MDGYLANGKLSTKNRESRFWGPTNKQLSVVKLRHPFLLPVVQGAGKWTQFEKVYMHS